MLYSIIVYPRHCTLGEWVRFILSSGKQVDLGSDIYILTAMGPKFIKSRLHVESKRSKAVQCIFGLAKCRRTISRNK